MAVISFEMSGVSLLARALAAESSVPSLALEDAIRNQSADVAAIYHAIGQQDSLPIRVSTKLRDANGIEGWVRRVCRQHGLDVLILDHVQMVPGDERIPLHISLNNAISRLRGLAAELKFAALVLSQINRASGGERLSLSAIRESSGLGAAADVALGLYRPKRRDETDPRTKTVLHFLKNRHGPDDKNFDQALEFDGAYSRFLPWSK